MKLKQASDCKENNLTHNLSWNMLTTSWNGGCQPYKIPVEITMLLKKAKWELHPPQPSYNPKLIRTSILTNEMSLMKKDYQQKMIDIPLFINEHEQYIFL